jgi:phosphoglycolate phosphatase-like HAD superfamily hydrolase
MRPTVLLFDIDGTLVTTGGVGRRALQRTFEVAFGRKDAISFPLDGMTDRSIVRGALKALGREASEAEIDEVLARYLTVLAEEVAGADLTKYRVHPGMEATIERALGHAEVAVGLGTGNVRAGAKLKLDRVGLYQHFAFGGFGCDHEVRVELIRRGAERGAARLNVPLAACRVVVIGDTPKDVAAAKGIGAECVGVGTGHFTPAQLIEAGATAAFDDLAQPGALRAVLSDP